MHPETNYPPLGWGSSGWFSVTITLRLFCYPAISHADKFLGTLS